MGADTTDLEYLAGQIRALEGVAGQLIIFLDEVTDFTEDDTDGQFDLLGVLRSARAEMTLTEPAAAGFESILEVLESARSYRLTQHSENLGHT